MPSHRKSEISVEVAIPSPSTHPRDTTSGRLCASKSSGCSKRPLRGPKTMVPASPAMPPVRWTTPRCFFSGAMKKTVEKPWKMMKHVGERWRCWRFRCLKNCQHRKIYVSHRVLAVLMSKLCFCSAHMPFNVGFGCGIEEMREYVTGMSLLKRQNCCITWKMAPWNGTNVRYTGRMCFSNKKMRFNQQILRIQSCG